MSTKMSCFRRLVARAAGELLSTGTYEALAGELDYGQINALVGKR